MGLLSEGTPLQWSEVSKYVDHVREHGIIQLLHTLEKYKNRQNDPFLWGDEVEYIVVNLSDGKATLGLRQNDILGKLMLISDSENVNFHPEYGRYMIESTPLKPFDASWDSLVDLETNMRHRRQIASRYMTPTEHLVTMSSYPLLGVGHFAETEGTVKGPVTQSEFMPDDVINLHPRFPTLSSNIRERRGKKVEITVPVFHDVNTPQPWVDPLLKDRPVGVSSQEIYMDAMGFGMGCCCLQLTFQGASIDGARDLYDALAPLTPLFLALSAGSPVFRGVVADQDVRWNVISQSVDDRTDDEKKTIPKSRYDSIDCYISRKNEILNQNTDFYNDIPVVTNDKVTEQLREGGLENDPLLVQHFSHYFIRDPLVIFEELLDQDDKNSMDHFENIQTTNWQTMRFKPPPNASIGWRTEFRPCEIQFTDFENAAFCVVVVLLARTIVANKLCFYQPISQIDENMKQAHVRDPVHRAKFWVRLSVQDQDKDSKPVFKQLTLNDIFNGNDEYIGLLPLVRDYLKSPHSEPLPEKVSNKVNQYLDLLSKRASGELDTAATWIRKFINSHPDYKHDSIVTEKINFDLVTAINKIGSGEGWNTIAQSMFRGF